MKKTTGALRNFRNDQSGSVFALLTIGFIVLVSLIVGAIDAGRMFRVRALLQTAADGAAQAALRDPDARLSVAQVVGERIFKEHSSGSIAANDPVFATDFSKNSGGSPASATVTASLDLPTLMLSAVGIKTLMLSVTATAAPSGTDTSVYVALDMSASMGLAADVPNRKLLEAFTAAATGGNTLCAFACHQRDASVPGNKTTWQIARDKNILLREDVVVAAFGKFVERYLAVPESASAGAQKRVAVIGFSDNAILLQSPTNSLSAAKQAPARFPNAARLNTRYDVVVPQIIPMLGVQGDGSPGRPFKEVLLVTDGVRFQRERGPEAGPIDAKLCDAIKGAGFTLSVLEIGTPDMNGKDILDGYVKPQYADVSPALKACASPGRHFPARDSDMATLTGTFESIAEVMKARAVSTR